MLHELRIANLALVDSLTLDCSGQETGLIVFTGETGAGKSIILQAIDLLTGRRASASWIRGDCDRAVIEAVFGLRTAQDELQELLREHDLEEDGQCLIRRVIEKNGRSRFYVNDRQITSRLAGMLGDLLVNIASQHDHQHLLIPRHHLDFLDSYGELLPLRDRFAQLFSHWQKLSSQLRALREQEQDKEQRRDFLQFQLREIRDAAPEAGEDEALLREREILKSSSALQSLAGTSHHLLETEVAQQLSIIRKNMEQAAAMDGSLIPLAERIASAGYEVEDLVSCLRVYLHDIPMDPARLEQINERLSRLKQLQRKYGPSLEDVLAHAERAASELARLDSMEEQIAALEKEHEQSSRETMMVADSLSQARKEVADGLAQAMTQELQSLCFPEAQFEIALSRPEGWVLEGLSSSGQDTVEFLFSANPGEPVKPLARVASGGELSRLMLAMKCLLARRDQVDTIIFDEVDSGISGRAAEAVAAKIRELAGHHQVLCITHLPQIAAFGDLHFLVEKSVAGGRTVSAITGLDEEKRIAELARMLGGSALTEQTMGFAKELIDRKKAAA